MTKQKKTKPKKEGMTLSSRRPDPYSLKDWRPTDFVQRKYTSPKYPKPKPYKPIKFTADPSTELIPKKRRKTTLRKNPTQGDVMRDMKTNRHFDGGLSSKKRRKKK